MIIKSVGKILLRILGEDIRFKTIISIDDVPIFADAHHIEQILMNLATNARDAMPKGGTFSITLEKVNLDNEFITLHGYGCIGEYAMITITDTGKGMDANTKEKMFEPFFTTKEVGKGTGLGMAVVYGIVKQHDGYINVYSEPEIGTTFRIYLPLIKEAIKEDFADSNQIYPSGGEETILLAEDNQSFMNVATVILKEFGYNVITAFDGEDAINKFSKYKDSIKLLLFDVIMPKQNGKEAYDEIVKIKPDVKIIFLSGYTPDVIQQKVSMDIGATVISKPILPITLLSEVRKVLDNR
jgi:CheY-like chemotaxis protein